MTALERCKIKGCPFRGRFDDTDGYCPSHLDELRDAEIARVVRDLDPNLLPPDPMELL